MQFEAHSNFTILNSFRNADLFIGAQSQHTAQHFANSLAYSQDEITWCVQKAKSRAKWKQMWLIADWKVFLCIFSTALPFTWIMYGLAGFEKRPFDVWTSAFMILRSITLTSPPFNPERSSVRFIYLLQQHLCFFASSIFLSFFFIIITRPFNEHQISSFEEIVKANFRLVAEGEMKQFFIDRNMVIVAFPIF